MPALDPQDIDDLYWGCAEPSGRQRQPGSGRGRAGGYDQLPGATINRFCASSVQTTRMAYHAIKAGEGDVFLSGGVECVSQYLSWAGAGGADDEARNPLFGDPMARTVETAKTNATWTDPRRERAPA